ncbi:MAG: hypothetical protein UY77_C0019G0021 [Candidatus Uhrbacteria bacterium GW2011_GWA2_53_10]|uniref:ATP synthase subunit alpha n=1 Tax=Candidatus Uhrbacteria bacterium GW2011_GWA2_53_10 TaxID=1618980 RepID=A0A0G1ZW27_9BACT|nr:MAG: hypothetical protein UY77_C0019G0021 [Candidatus Uhrbacteria bacterium GW2011_GWA2_53_10]
MTLTNDLIKALEESVSSFRKATVREHVGIVSEVGDGVARIEGLSKIGAMETVDFGHGITGVALNLNEDSTGVIILSDAQSFVKKGSEVKATGLILSVPAGEQMIGRIVDPLGNPKDSGPKIESSVRYPIEKVAPGVIKRTGVNCPMQTGIIAVDSMIPIGRGQRELVIGDRQTGKTALAIDAILNQKSTQKTDRPVICIYVAIGQKESKVARIVADLKERGAMDYTIVVSASASESAALSYIAPFAGCAMGEYFVDRGKDVLVIYDDLSKHAWAYRQVSLLLRRPPGREAYPAGDIAAYIPTNVISITDGQIFLESSLFYKGIRPAVNIGNSVSRVGSAAQRKSMKKVAGRLRIDLAQYRDLEVFAQFGSDLDSATKKQLDRGARLTEILKQAKFSPMTVGEQVAVLYAGVNGYIDDVPVSEVKRFQHEFLIFLNEKHFDLLEALEKEISAESEEQLKRLLESFNKK